MLLPKYQNRKQQKAPLMRVLHRVGTVLVLLAIGAAIPAGAQAPGSYWCEPRRAYYPQAASCPVPWRTVTPGEAAAAQPAPPPWVPYNTQYAPYDNYNHKG